MGWAFADGPVLAPCLTNCLNALCFRHLAAPSNAITDFICKAWGTQVAKTAVIAKDILATNPDGWEVGKGERKLRAIEQSQSEDKKREDRVNLMVKKEVYPQLIEQPKPLKKARGIQFCVNQRTAYEHADQAYALTKAFAEVSKEEFVLSNVQFTVQYAGGMPHAEIGQFASESERLRSRYTASYIDERDGSNWDANIQVPHRTAVCDAYALIFPDLAEKARAAIKVKGHVRVGQGLLKYWVDGTVKSGHWDTSLGNSLLNREVSVQAILALPPALRPVKVRALVMGDDYIAWLYFDKAVDTHALRVSLDKEESALGISPTRGLFSEVLHASFISLGFYRTTADTVVALPKVGRMFAKLFWTVTPLNGRCPLALASGTASQFLPLYYQWAPMRHYLEYHMQVAAGDAVPVFYDWQELGLKRLDAPIDWDYCHFVKYGIGPGAVDVSWIRGQQGAGLAHDPVVASLYREDVSDPCDRRGALL